MASPLDQLYTLVKCMRCSEVKGRQKLLACQHSACLDCLRSLSAESDDLKCPVCSQVTHIPDDGIESLSESMMIAELYHKIQMIEMTIPPSQQVRPKRLPPDVEKKVQTLKTQAEKHQQQVDVGSKQLQKIKEGISEAREWLTNKLSALDEAEKFHQTFHEDLQEKHQKKKNELQAAIDRATSAQAIIEDMEVDALKADNSELTTLHETSVIKPGHNVRIRPTLESIKDEKNPPMTSVGRVEQERLSMPNIDLASLHHRMLSPEKQLWVMFPERLRWCGTADKLMLTSDPCDKDMLCEDDRVRIKSTITKPKHGWQGVDNSAEGRLRLILYEEPKLTLPFMSSDDKEEDDNNPFVLLRFPTCEQWKGYYQEIERLPGSTFQVGDEVRVKLSGPEGTQKKLSEIGQVTKVDMVDDKEVVTVLLPDGTVWTGNKADVKYEYQPVCSQTVMVRPAIKEPLYGWQGCSANRVGTLIKICKIDEKEVGIIDILGRNGTIKHAMSELQVASEHQINNSKIGKKKANSGSDSDDESNSSDNS